MRSLSGLLTSFSGALHSGFLIYALTSHGPLRYNVEKF
jgi:hypothetical protein